MNFYFTQWQELIPVSLYPWSDQKTYGTYCQSPKKKLKIFVRTQFG